MAEAKSLVNVMFILQWINRTVTKHGTEYSTLHTLVQVNPR